MAELTVEEFDDVLGRDEPYYYILVLQAQGSTPRNAGAAMIVGRDKILGTIGGGSAEWVAIQRVRGFIDGAEIMKGETITLGPQIDQCCGGVLEVSYQLVTENLRKTAIPSLGPRDNANILIFGAGHTGLALANAFVPLGMNVEIIDTRAQYAQSLASHNFRCLALPEEAVRSAKKGSIFVITTHNHSLDFLITAEALSRGDAAYVGMIGSTTKRAVLKSWLGDNNYDSDSIENLHCPIGGASVRNKQPEIIAAMTVAEILSALD
jgi:xanthine dehydrogenase accessory factor